VQPEVCNKFLSISLISPRSILNLVIQLSTFLIFSFPPKAFTTIFAISSYFFSFISLLSKDGESSLPGVFKSNLRIAHVNTK